MGTLICACIVLPSLTKLTPLYSLLSLSLPLMSLVFPLPLISPYVPLFIASPFFYCDYLDSGFLYLYTTPFLSLSPLLSLSFRSMGFRSLILTERGIFALSSRASLVLTKPLSQMDFPLPLLFLSLLFFYQLQCTSIQSQVEGHWTGKIV